MLRALFVAFDDPERENRELGKEGVEASSKTYNKCTNLLAKAGGLPPADFGLGPRANFEYMVSLVRAKLNREDKPVGKKESPLTQNDFSFNQILSVMRITAQDLATDQKKIITRDEFIRKVNSKLEDEQGLRKVLKVKTKATSGRFPWLKTAFADFLLSK